MTFAQSQARIAETWDFPRSLRVERLAGSAERTIAPTVAGSTRGVIGVP